MRWIAGCRAGKGAQQMKFAELLISNLVLCLITASLLLQMGCTGLTGKAEGAATAVPAVPTGLKAAPGNAQVMLHWTASSGATGYYVKRSTTSGGPYTQISTQAAANFADTSLSNGTKYFYVVSAYNSAGQSADSATVSATPVLQTTAQRFPAPPSSIR
jgi:hypothetical protein